jgi:hypothetical protein
MKFTKEQIELLEKSTDPAIAAIALTLKELVGENLIPQSEFNKKNQKLQDALKAVKSELLSEITDEETRKIIEQLPDAEAILDFRRKYYDKKKIDSGKVDELTNLLKQRELELEKTKEQLGVDSKDAELYRIAHKAQIETIKKKMGDDWRDSYATLPLEDLAKLANQQLTIIGSINGEPDHTTEKINPFSKKTRNLAEQVRIKKENPVLAKQLEAEAI